MCAGGLHALFASRLAYLWPRIDNTIDSAFGLGVLGRTRILWITPWEVGAGDIPQDDPNPTCSHELAQMSDIASAARYACIQIFYECFLTCIPHAPMLSASRSHSKRKKVSVYEVDAALTRTRILDLSHPSLYPCLRPLVALPKHIRF